MRCSQSPLGLWQIILSQPVCLVRDHPFLKDIGKFSLIFDPYPLKHANVLNGWSQSTKFSNFGYPKSVYSRQDEALRIVDAICSSMRLSDPNNLINHVHAKQNLFIIIIHLFDHSALCFRVVVLGEGFSIITITWFPN